MTVFNDAHGLAVTCASQVALDAYDHAIDGYLKNRNDTSQRVKACITADGAFALALTLRGLFAMLAFKRENLDYARKCLGETERAAANATPREKMHAGALAAWVGGDLDRAMTIWEDICAQWPRDVLAFRMHHFIGFWLGRPEAMLAQVERILPAWSDASAAYPSILACRAFAHEECGSYVTAENAGRQAIALDPGDIWAAHAIAHVLEMQGRRGEGLLFLRAQESHWAGGNNLLHHLWWHRALFHLERREFEEALALYDERFRNLASPLTLQMPDLYIDMQNAVSMLWRFERCGLDVGGRWSELAEKASARAGDCSNPFTLPHFMLALTRMQQFDAAQRNIEGMREFVEREQSSLAPAVREAALPICEAILADARGDVRAALDLMRPALGVMHRLGGSHAQQDLLEQLFADYATRAQSKGDLALICERVRGRRPLALADMIGWRDVNL